MTRINIEIVKQGNGYTFYKYVDGIKCGIEATCPGRNLYSTMKGIVNYYNNAPDEITVTFTLG